MKFKVGEIILKNVSVKFKDDVTGNDVFFFLGSFDTHIKTFDPYKSKYAVPDINISGIRSSVRQYKPLIKPKPEAVAEAKSNEPINVDLELGIIEPRALERYKSITDPRQAEDYLTNHVDKVHFFRQRISVRTRQ